MLGMPDRLAAEPSRRKILALGAGLTAGLALIALGALHSGSDSRSSRVGSQTRLSPKAELGQAPSSELFNQTYQVQLERMVHEQMQSFRAELDSRDRARDARDSVQMDRFARLVNESAQRNAGAADRAIHDPSPEELPKFVMVRDMSNRVGPTLASGAPASAVSSAAFSGSMAGTPSATVSGTRETDPYIIPQDGWAEGRLINGVVAAQGGEFRYTEIKLQGNYHSANDYEHNTDGCVVLGESTADVAAGRINIKPIKLTCTLPSGRSKTWQTAGYVVDARDGIQGIVGTLVNSGESKLAAAAGAGLIQGGGAFYAQRSVTNTFSSSTGTTASILTGNPTNALIGGAVEGGGRGLGQEIQNYYSAFRPTVQTGGGIEVVVFITTSMPLPEGGEAISEVRAAR